MRQIPVTRPDVRESDRVAVDEVLQSGMLVQGQKVRSVEQQIGSYLGVPNVLLFSSGTATLHLALLAFGVGPGDEVLVPAFSYVATANVVELVGATPVFVDVDLTTFNMIPDRISEKITERTKAIVPVHEFGHPVDVDRIRKALKGTTIPIIEDAACAFGTVSGHRFAGTIGDMGSFSFHPRKSVTSGEGGALVISNPEMVDYLRSMRSHGVVSANGSSSYHHAGFNYRMTDIQAALVQGQIKRLELILERRRQIAAQYQLRIQNDNIVCPSQPMNGMHSWQSFHILLPSRRIRERFTEHATKNGVQTLPGAQCIPMEPFYQKKYGFDAAEYPNAFSAATCGLVLPLFPGLTDGDIDQVVDAANSFA